MSHKRTVLKATAVITAFAVAGKLLGFAREMIIAAKFGTTFRADAYFIGLAGPDFIREIISGGALTAVFIPMYSSFLHNNDEAQSKKLLDNAASVLLVLLLSAVIIGLPFAPWLVKAVAPEMSGESFVLAVQVSRIIFPAMLFMGFANLYGSLLNTLKHFAMPSMGQLIQNICIIIGAVLLSRQLGVNSIAVGFLAGAALQLAVLLPVMQKYSIGFSFDLSLSPAFIKMLRMWGPLFLVSIVSTVNDLVNRSLAAGLDVGSVSAINFSNRIRETTLLLSAVPLATAVFPLMSQFVAKDDKLELANITRFALRLVTFVALPMCLAMLLYSKEIVRILFQRGMFNAASTAITSTALVFYSSGALFVALSYVILRLYYSFQDSRTPLIAFSVACVINISLGIVLRKYLFVGGIALARSVADLSTFVILALLLKRLMNDFSQKDFWGYFMKTGIIALISISISRLIYSMLPPSINIYTQCAFLGAALCFAAAAYMIACKVFKIEESEKIIHIIKSKLAPSNG